MKGRKDQSLSAAGSVPSPVPNQLSISGPLSSGQTVLFWALAQLLLGGVLPRVVETHDADNGRKAAVWWHRDAFEMLALALRPVHVPRLLIGCTIWSHLQCK